MAEATIGMVLDCVEVASLESLGARRLEGEARAEHGMRWFVMADPEGNEFCVCGAEQ